MSKESNNSRKTGGSAIDPQLGKQRSLSRGRVAIPATGRRKRKSMTLLIDTVIGEVKYYFKFAEIASYHSRIAIVSEAEIYA
jgi:hypothetical protein